MNKRAKRSITVLAIACCVNLGLAIAKLFVGLSANSLCILIDSTNSFFDILTGIVTLLSFVMLVKPTTDDKPFGWGRLEYVAGCVVAIASVVMGGVFLMQSVNRLAMPEPVWFGWQSCLIISVAAAVKAGMAVGYALVNRRLQSPAIRALVWDSVLDLGISLFSILSFALSGRVNYAVDAWFGIAISLLSIGCGIKLTLDNLRLLAGRGNTVQWQAPIRELCLADPHIEQVHAVILHDYGHDALQGEVLVVWNTDDLQEILSVAEQLQQQIKQQIGVQVYLVPCRPKQ